MKTSSILPAFLVIVASAAAAQQDDTITLKDDRKQQGRITDHDFGSVKLAMKGGASTVIKSAEVKSVEYAGAPKELREAEGAIAAGRDEEAVAKLKEVLENKKHRRVFRQDAYFHLGQAQARLGQHDEAVATLRAMLADGEFPASRHLPTIEGLILDCAVAAGKLEDGLGFLNSELARLSKTPETAPVADQVRVLVCRGLFRKGDLPAAKAAAEKIASGSGEAAAEAKAMLGDIALAGNDAAAAERCYREALASGGAIAAKGSAYNGLGELLLRKGFEQKKSEILTDALLAFLRSVVQYTPAEGASTQTHETAIYKAGICFQNIAELSKPGDGQNRYFARARELYRRLLSTYPQSQHMTDAKARLERLGG